VLADSVLGVLPTSKECQGCCRGSRIGGGVGTFRMHDLQDVSTGLVTVEAEDFGG
jgi:hypothetical protein